MWKTRDRRISIKGRIVAKNNSASESTVSDRDRDCERERVRCRLLCHDLDYDAEFFCDDAIFYRNSSRRATSVMVSRTLDTAYVPIHGQLHAHIVYPNIHTVHVYTSRASIVDHGEAVEGRTDGCGRVPRSTFRVPRPAPASCCTDVNTAR